MPRQDYSLHLQHLDQSGWKWLQQGGFDRLSEDLWSQTEKHFLTYSLAFSALLSLHMTLSSAQNAKGETGQKWIYSFTLVFRSLQPRISFLNQMPKCKKSKLISLSSNFYHVHFQSIRYTYRYTLIFIKTNKQKNTFHYNGKFHSVKLKIGFSGDLVIKETSCNAGDPSPIPELGRSPGGRQHGNPLQYSCLENPMDRGTWQAIVHNIAESNTTECTCTHTMKRGVRFKNIGILLLPKLTFLGQWSE